MCYSPVCDLQHFHPIASESSGTKPTVLCYKAKLLTGFFFSHVKVKSTCWTLILDKREITNEKFGITLNPAKLLWLKPRKNVEVEMNMRPTSSLSLCQLIKMPYRKIIIQIININKKQTKSSLQMLLFYPKSLIDNHTEYPSSITPIYDSWSNLIHCTQHGVYYRA